MKSTAEVPAIDFTAPFTDGDVGALTRDWFAEGDAAERALRTLTKSAPLPRIYSEVEFEPPPSPWRSPRLIAAAAAALLLGAVLLF